MAKHIHEDEWRIPIQKLDVGDKVTTKSRTITRTDVELFAIMGGDYAPQFLSDRAARDSGWKTQLLPGVCTLNIAYGLLIQAGYLSDIVAYMGTDNLRFHAPVYPGDAIRMETQLTKKKQTSKGWVCEYDWIIWNQARVAVATGHNI